MIKLISNIVFMVFLFLLTILFCFWGYSHETYELYFLGIGLPFYVIWIIGLLKQLNKLLVKDDCIEIDNLFFKKQFLYYDEIESWELIETIRVAQTNLIIRTKKKKIVISGLSDVRNFEDFRHKLRVHYPNKQIGCSK